MNTSDRGVLEQHIEEWARARKSNISLRTFAWEIDAIRTATGVGRFRNVLEIGCGSGLFLVTCVALGLADRGSGIDPAHGSAQSELVEGQTLAEKLALDIKLENQSMEGLLSTDGPRNYDLVVFRGSLHHIYDRALTGTADEGVVARCIEDLARVRKRFLETGGHMWIAELTRPGAVYSFLYTIYQRAKGQGRFDWDAKRTANEWTEILVAAGMENILATRQPVNKFIGTPLENSLGMALSNVALIAAASR